MLMKKLITLLLVLTGMVSTASAWTATLKGSFDSWGSGVAFTNINDNEMFVKISGDFIHSSTLYFKAYINDKGERGPGSDTSINTNGTLSSYTNSTGGAYTISQNANAEDIYIYLKKGDSDDWWAFAALVVEDYTSYPVKFSSTWGSVNAYVYNGYFPIYGKWPGTVLSSTSGSCTTTISALPGSKVIFTNGLSGDDNKTGDLDLVQNGVYSKASGLSAITASITAVGYATFSSLKAVDFTDEETIEACKASVDGSGNITYTKVTSVAAGEGVLLRRADKTIAAASSDIPLNADQSVSANSGNDFVGITSLMQVAQTMGGKNAYILAKPDAKPLGFYKPATGDGSWCGAGTAYLATTYTPGARGFFGLDDDATSIEAVKAEQKMNGECYNLAGQRVAQPTKGLYIVNGKKYIVK